MVSIKKTLRVIAFTFSITPCLAAPEPTVLAVAGPVASPSYLAQLKALEKEGVASEAAVASAVDTNDKQKATRDLLQVLDQLGIVQSQTGDTVGAHVTLSTVRMLNARRHPIEQPLSLDDTIATNAIDTIVTEARNRQIVILNESHHDPMHRAFAARLATELRKLGFAYLACETFGVGVKNLKSDSITRHAGYYTGDPVFAEFVRESVQAGYTLVPYEHIPMNLKLLSPEEILAAREDGQAQNIIAATLAKNPQAKIFIYVGYGHVRKAGGDIARWSNMMAARLWKRTGIDPLTIDQTTMTAQPAAHDRLEIYNKVLLRYKPTDPIVLKSAKGKYAVFNRYYSGSVDLQVIFPDYGQQSGRPAWLATLAKRTPSEIPKSILPNSGRRLVQAFHKQDGADNVPADMVMVEAGKESPVLMLPKGNFRLAYED